ncbi:MAG: UMP kinase [Pseudomonadota bacterium]
MAERVLLKLSGEALMGEDAFGINPDIIQRLAVDIARIQQTGVQIGLVIGGGNIFRGAGLAGGGFDRVAGDQMGMLATVMNALAMQDHLRRQGVTAKLLSAVAINGIGEPYQRDHALHYLTDGQVVLFAAGTGNPLFTTDTAASLRAIEIRADLMIKATRVDGVYSADPLQNPEATFYPRLSYQQVLDDRLAVMDATAVTLCADHQMPLRVLNIHTPGAMQRAIQGEPVGTLITT